MSKKQSQEYKGNEKHDWEHVTGQTIGPETVRLRVPGGWVYYMDGAFDNTAVYVPMPEVVKHKV